jgi:hypothetical protein
MQEIPTRRFDHPLRHADERTIYRTIDMTEDRPPSPVPRTPEELAAVVRDRPLAWEYLLFAGILLIGKQDLELRWRDHRLGLPTGEYHRVEEDDVPRYASEMIGRLAWLLEPINRVFAPDAQEEAFGAPGESGDPRVIEHFAGWIITAYAKVLDWAGTVRSAGVPDEFDRAIALIAHAADSSLQAIRSFIDGVVAQLDELPAKLAEREEGDEPLELHMTLTLEADEQLLNEAIAELQGAVAESST